MKKDDMRKILEDRAKEIFTAMQQKCLLVPSSYNIEDETYSQLYEWKYKMDHLWDLFVDINTHIGLLFGTLEEKDDDE